MEIEIKASEYSTPAELVGAIREQIGQLYVDWVWVKFSGSRQKVTPNTADDVCKGLMMAHELSLDQIEADGGDPRAPSYGVAGCGGEMPKCEWAEHPADDEGRLIREDGSDDAFIIAHGKLMEEILAEDALASESQRIDAETADEKPDGQAENVEPIHGEEDA